MSYYSECLVPGGLCEGSCNAESEHSVVLKVSR
jgi:hypothetical protein